MSLSGAPGDQDAPPGPFLGLRPSSPGWISGVGVEGILFCSDPLLCPEMESEKKARGVLVRASLCLPSSASSEDRGSGGARGVACRWWGWTGSLADTQSGSWCAGGRWAWGRAPLPLPSLISPVASLRSADLHVPPVSRSLKALAPPPAPGPRLPLPPVLQFRECPAPPPPSSLEGNLCPTPEPHSHP